MTANDENLTFQEAREKYPTYNLRVYVGGIYICANWEDLDKHDMKRFRGSFYIDHSCNEIDLTDSK